MLDLRGQIPQAETLVPGSGKSVLAIGGERDVGNVVSVSKESTDWASGDGVVGASVLGERPNDEGLVCKSTHLALPNGYYRNIPREALMRMLGFSAVVVTWVTALE